MCLSLVKSEPALPPQELKIGWVGGGGGSGGGGGGGGEKRMNTDGTATLSCRADDGMCTFATFQD